MKITQNTMKHHFLHKFILLSVMCFLLSSWSQPLPILFLIGDSISIQYGPYLETFLKDAVHFERKQDDGKAEKNLDIPTGANGGDSRMVLEYLRLKLRDPDFKADYMLLNCGLHDIKRNPATKEIQVTEEEYRENLNTIFQLMLQRNIQLIWIRTTPVVDSIHNAKQRSFHRFADDVSAYNKIADEICEMYNVPAIDLHSFSQQLGVEQFIDHVHFSEYARAMQGAFIAGFVKRCIASSNWSVAMR